MEITELLKNYSSLKRKYSFGALAPGTLSLYESVTTVIGSGELFPVLKAHYIDGLTVDAIAEQLGYESRTIYRRQKVELTELETIITGKWLM